MIIRPLKQRIDDYLAALPVETSMAQVFERILHVMSAEQLVIERKILDSRTLLLVHFHRLKAELGRIQDDIAIIRALHSRHRGDPIPARVAPTPHAPLGAGYGEP